MQPAKNSKEVSSTWQSGNIPFSQHISPLPQPDAQQHQIQQQQQQQQRVSEQPLLPSVTRPVLNQVMMGATPQNDLAVLFECPVCFDYALPPIIYQCDSGHIICTPCKQKVQCCPSCRGPLGGVRNLAMEKVADSVQFPCKYITSGCREKMHHSTKRQHEEQCPFRPYSCPCPGTTCTWQGGNLDMVLNHLLSAHKTITTLVGEDIVFLATDINLPGAVDWVMMQCCFDKYFILVLEKQERHEGHQQFFAVVQLIGAAKDAEEFR